ncbi:MAG: hypothetical protein E7418_01940 [Ruminococcaceae bacterium]|nr:hypothetical protein [Oscillospiraceae bacterium]
MKKVKLLLTMAVIVFATMICCSMSAFALAEGDFEFQLGNNEVTITKYIGDGGEAVIPETIYGCPVTKIDKAAFYMKNVTSIKINAKITEIPYNFAYQANDLTEVIIPEGVTTIASNAFYYCDKLETLQLPSTLEKIETSAFSECHSLKKVTLPKGLKSVGSGVFEYTAIEEITIPASLKKAGGLMFGECTSLKSVVFEEGCETVFDGMFSGCKALEKVELANTITTIGSGAFSSCSSLKELVLPTGLKVIKAHPFYGCSISELIIPYGVEEIWTLTFDNNTIKSIFIPDTVTKIEQPIIDSKRCPNAIVYCGDGSAVAEHCQKKNISYLTDSSVNSGIHVLYNGERISFHSYSQNPEILDGRTLVPLRSIFEAMGADVEWDGTTSTAIAKRGNVEVKITIGANEIYKNGKAIPVDVPAMLLNSRTMVPARVIAEAFGADVDWNGNGRVVLITE